MPVSRNLVSRNLQLVQTCRRQANAGNRIKLKDCAVPLPQPSVDPIYTTRLIITNRYRVPYSMSRIMEILLNFAEASLLRFVSAA